MLFSSYEFIFLFLPIALAGTFLFARAFSHSAALFWLSGVSILFYSWWDIANLPILLGSMATNYCLSFLFGPNHSEHKRKIVLYLGVGFNLTLLWYYKYAVAIMHAWAWSEAFLPPIDRGLPLAISFFTFQQIAYLVDTYRQQSPPQKLLQYVVFVTFFPQLISGPIVRDREVIPQLLKEKLFTFNQRNFYCGLLLFSIGLVKKTVLGDSLSSLTNEGWDHATQLSMIEGWIVTLAWTLQLYFDFSAYSDMALGIGLMLNIRLPINFLSPYRATSIIELWQCWHMSLTRWINTYLYRPLMRARKKFSFTYAMFCTLTCMLVIGVWHGAALSYVLFGAAHGSALVINHLWRKYKFSMPDMVGRAVTFFFITVAMVLNTSRNWHEIIALYQSLYASHTQKWTLLREEYLNLHNTPWDYAFSHLGTNQITILLLLGISLAIVFYPRNSIHIVQEAQVNLKTTLSTGLLLAIGIICIDDYRAFHYFQF